MYKKSEEDPEWRQKYLFDSASAYVTNLQLELASAAHLPNKASCGEPLSSNSMMLLFGRYRYHALRPITHERLRITRSLDNMLSLPRCITPSRINILLVSRWLLLVFTSESVSVRRISVVDS